MAASSSSPSCSERPTSPGKPAQQEKETTTSMALPKKSIKLIAEVCHLRDFHLLRFLLKEFLPFHLT